MKKILLIMLAIVTIYSCQKKDQDLSPATAEVVFSIDKIDPGNGLKSPSFDFLCATDGNGDLIEPVDAYIIIDGIEYFVPVFRLDGKLYTQAIKLDALDGSPKTYTVSFFALRDGSGNILMATPGLNGDYSEYVSKTVDFTFEVNAFAKAEVAVEVLCYLPETHDYFGFTWFNVTEIVVREFCFYGDICLTGFPWSPSDFDGSLYDTDQLPAGTQPDMPAIFEVHVYKNGQPVPNQPFTNATIDDNFGVGQPLCVQYPDRLNEQGEEFTFELWILTKRCDGTFGYELFHTYTTIDDAPLPDIDGDGVTDFVVGDCNYSTTDLELNHFTWLVLKDLWDENNPTGFLFTSDPTNGALWKWQRTNTAAAHNITEPMAHYLNQAGYTEIAETAFEAILYDLSPPLNNRFWSTTMSGLMTGYLITGNIDYMNMANSIMPAVYAKYHPSGTAPPRASQGVWGYDYLNYLRSAKSANDNGVTGGVTYYNDLYNDYIANYTTFAATDYDRIFINVIAAELGIGTFQGTVVWDDNIYGIQEAAYGLMAGTWDDPAAARMYIRDNICSAGYSEPVAEAIYALGL